MWPSLILMAFCVLLYHSQPGKWQQETSVPTDGLVVPGGLSLDSVVIVDSSRALHIAIILPKSTNKQLQTAERLLTKLIEANKDSFVRSIDTRLKEDGRWPGATGNEYRVYPEQLYKDSNYISYLLTITIYHAGAAHPKADYFSFNYDVRRQKQLKFEDYFTINWAKDSIALLNAMNAYFGDSSIHVTDLNNIDFNFDKKMIWFNFGDYEIASYAEGRQRAEFDRIQLTAYIDRKYIK